MKQDFKPQKNPMTWRNLQLCLTASGLKDDDPINSIKASIDSFLFFVGNPTRIIEVKRMKEY